MKLYLVRHGDSLAAEVDPNKPLSEKGKSETEHVAALLSQHNLEIGTILCSTKLRAKETAMILARKLAPNVIPEERAGLAPSDPIDAILEEITHMSENIMIVSHLPFLAQLISKLLFNHAQDPHINICGSCVICLSSENSLWNLQWMVTPKLAFHDHVHSHSS